MLSTKNSSELYCKNTLKLFNFKKLDKYIYQ